jgi:phosphopantothenoylcysteine decarboxylase/phosphopantothenate--cysteine ligase
MNWRMYENPIFQENLKSIVSRGFIQIGPERGSLACGEEGIGRMADVPDIVDAVKSAFTKKDLSGENVLITAGPTREYLDPVRFISNKSSGKMGYALAKAASRRGAKVTLISGHSALNQPKGVTFISVDTAAEMFRAIKKHIKYSSSLIMSAAVSDFMPADTAPDKIQKTNRLLLRLKATPDIISQLRMKRNRPFIIGFAAETGKKIGRAKGKLSEKNMDMIVFNDVTDTGAGFDVDTNKVVLIDKNTIKKLPLMSKDSVADAILDRMLEIKT